MFFPAMHSSLSRDETSYNTAAMCKTNNSVSRFKVRLEPSRCQHVVQRKIALSVRSSLALDRSCGINAGRATARMMFGRTAPKLCSSPTHRPPKSFCFTCQNPKACAPVSVPHTPRCPVYFVSHPKTLHITTPHTRFLPQYAHVQRDFPTHPRRRRIFRPGFSPPKPICPPDFSSPTPDCPVGSH